MNSTKKNESYLIDITRDDFQEAIEYKFLCMAIRRFFIFDGTDEQLIEHYYNNDFLLQNLMTSELEKHINKYMDIIMETIVENFKFSKTNNDLPMRIIEDSIFKFFHDKNENSGLFDMEISWFMSTDGYGGILDSTPINEIMDLIEEYDHNDSNFYVFK